MVDAAPQTPCLLIGTPCYGRQVTDLYAGSLLKLQPACHARGVGMKVLMLGSDALITRARQNVVAHFLADEAATHLLFIDADIGFEPEQVFRLLDFDVDMAAAVYPLKRLDWPRIKTSVAKGWTRPEVSSLSYMVEFADPAGIEVERGFARVSFAGTGFLMIRRQALLDMIARHPELRYAHDQRHDDSLAASPWRCALFNCLIDEDTGVYLSEDFSFCRRWTDMGGEIWADLESKLTHVGAVSFAGDFSTQFTAAE